jgi:hypothetical protein
LPAPHVPFDRRNDRAHRGSGARAVTKVDFHKDARPPLLVVGNTQDHT